MTSIQIDIKDGLSSSVAIKGPCKVATTANITLVGEQTIDGVAVVTDDRVLVKDQTTASENGIYIADTGNWRRSKDFNKTKDVKTGTMVNVVAGAAGAGQWQLTTADPITVGTTNLTFARLVLAASQMIDEDDMASNSDTKVPTQQSVKAYADTKLPVFNIEHYGASSAASAATNDTAIAACMAAASAAGGGKVYVPAKTYMHSQAVVMKSGVELFGDGYASVLKANSLDNGGAGIGHRQIDCNGISNFSIHDLTLDASGMTAWAAGMRSVNCSNASHDYTIEHVQFITPGGAVASIGCYNYRIISNDAIFSSTDSASHSDGTFDQWAGSHDFIIRDNTVLGNGIAVYPILVTGEDSASLAAGCSNFSITGNTVKSANAIGIWVNGRKGVNADFSITNNLVLGATNYFGIAVSDSVRGIVSGNKIRETGLNAIRLYSETGLGGVTSVVSVVVDGNEITNSNLLTSASTTDGAAIAILNICQNNSITNNRVSGSLHTFAVAFAAGAVTNFAYGNNLNAGTRGSILKGSSTNVIQRQKLTAAATYYVRTDGNDTNDGLADTSLRAFLTVQGAVDAINTGVDTAGFDVTVNVGAGTRTAAVTVNGPMVGGGTLSIIGDTATPSNCILNTTSADGFYTLKGARLTVRGFKITTTTTGSCLHADSAAVLTYGNIEFGSCAAAQVEVGVGCSVSAAFNYTINGGAVSHLHTNGTCLFSTSAITVTLSGTPAFSYFAGADGGIQLWSSVTFSGSGTGKRYQVKRNGTIDAGTTSLTFLPGNAAGTMDSGGKYAGDVTSQDIIGDVGAVDGVMVVTNGTRTDTVKGHASGAPGTAAFKNTGTSGSTVPLLDGTNIWSNPQTVTNLISAQYGFGAGALTLGADVNAATVTTLVRKLGRIGSLPYTNGQVNSFVIGSDNDGTNNTVAIGGTAGASLQAATIIDFVTAAALNTAGGTSRAQVKLGLIMAGATGGDIGAGTINATGLYVNGVSSGPPGAPVVKTADFTIATTEKWLVNNKAAATCTVTLPAAASFIGREITISNRQAFTVVSASSNVVPIAGGAAATAILAATAGKFATLVSDGTNWIIMAAN